MMRNVAIGAVLGFGLMVLVLAVFGREAPPPAPPPAVVAAPPPPAEVDAGAGAAAPVLNPLNAAPVVVVPQASPARESVMRAFARERGAPAIPTDATGDAGP